MTYHCQAGGKILACNFFDNTGFVLTTSICTKPVALRHGQICRNAHLALHIFSPKTSVVLHFYESWSLIENKLIVWLISPSCQWFLWCFQLWMQLVPNHVWQIKSCTYWSSNSWWGWAQPCRWGWMKHELSSYKVRSTYGGLLSQLVTKLLVLENSGLHSLLCGIDCVQNYSPTPESEHALNYKPSKNTLLKEVAPLTYAGISATIWKCFQAAPGPRDVSACRAQDFY